MKSKAILGAVFLSADLCAFSAYLANGFKVMAEDLSRAAKEAGMKRVTILPSAPTDGNDSQGGWSISERLTTRMARAGKVRAVELEAERDWLDASPDFGTNLAALWVPVPDFPVEVPSMPSSEASDIRDAPADQTCADAAERVDRMEEQILDIKARYWAAQLKKGVSLDSVRENPGSMITDPLLKKNFYDRMRYWYDAVDAPGLNPAEIQRFISTDEKAYSLYHECGG